MSQENHEQAPTGQVAEPVVTELPGNRLRQAREGAHLSREEVGHHLRLDPSLIRALEEDDYSKLPSPAYICGYLRSYARLLKLDEREIVNAYSKGQVISSALIPENINILPGKKVNYGVFKWLLVLLLIAALIGAGLWLLEQPDMFEKINGEAPQTDTVLKPLSLDEAPQTPQEAVPAAIVDAIEDVKQAGPAIAATQPQAPEESAAQPAPVQQATTRAAAATAEIARSEPSPSATTTVANLRLYFREDSWTEVTDSESNRLVYRLARAGTELQLDIEPPFTILLGNAPGVDVYYKNELFDHTRYHRNEIAYFRIGA